MDYNLLITFSKVAELGSFTKASKVLNQPKSRVSRAISRLEDELQVQLIRRTTRKSSLTSSGQEFFKSITPLLNGLDSELTKISNLQSEMSGSIRITASESIGQTLVASIISAYVDRFPNVHIETIITNDFLDLTKENIDIAFRAGKLEDSTLIQKKFTKTNFIFVCSSSYIEKYGKPIDLDSLHQHKFLSFKSMEQDLFNLKQKLNIAITSDSMPMLMKMVLDDKGITTLPDFFCEEFLRDKSLVRLFPGLKSKPGNIHILYPPSKIISRKVKAFIELANELF